MNVWFGILGYIRLVQIMRSVLSQWTSRKYVGQASDILPTQIPVVFRHRQHRPDGLNDPAGGEPTHAPLQGVDQLVPLEGVFAFEVGEEGSHFLLGQVSKRQVKLVVLVRLEC